MLRHQVVILRRKSPHPRLTTFDRFHFLLAAAVLPTWRRALAIVQPETVLRWHREGFRMFWRRRSQPGSVNRRVTAETISLVRQPIAFNLPTCRSRPRSRGRHFGYPGTRSSAARPSVRAHGARA